MRKWLIFICSVFLAGCPGYKDKFIIDSPAQVIVVDNNVCILVSGAEGEYVTSVQLYSNAGARMHKTFNTPSTWLYVGKSTCLPTLNFTFTKGDTYSVYYNIENNTQGSIRFFAAHFSLSEDNQGRLHITQYQK